MNTLNNDIILRLRQMARDGNTASKMFDELKSALGPEAHIVLIIDYLRSAFCLSLAEVKPIAAYSRNDTREINNGESLDQLIMPIIADRREAWDVLDDEKTNTSNLIKRMLPFY